jgi:aminoglycoside phosphotransferase (APT) family kinase protein
VTASTAPQKPVRDPASYEAKLDAWMRGQRPELSGLRVHDVDAPTATGFSNETVFFSISYEEAGATRTQRLVARIEPEGGGLFPIQTPVCEISVGLQHRIMSAVSRSGVAPVPPMLPYEANPTVIGSPFFAMEFVDGVVPADVPRYSQAGFLVDEATPAQREAMVRDGIEKMAALNKLDWKKTGLEWLDIRGQGDPTMADQLRLYRDYVVGALGDRQHPVMMRSLDWLDANVPAAESGLSWGDARLGNIIWKDYRAAAVVDWEAAALCPPEADIGWWVMFDRMSFDDLGAPRLDGFPTREEMLTWWEELTGRRVGADIHYWEVYAVMRFCAIMIKLGDRFVKAGLGDPDQSPAIHNGVTDALDRLLSA